MRAVLILATALCGALLFAATMPGIALAQENGPPPAQSPAAEKTAQTPDDSETADYVRTTTGLVFHGKIVEETPEKVVVRTKSGLVPIPRAVIAEVHKAGVDYRSPSEKIQAVPIPAGEEAAYLDKAKGKLKEGSNQEAAAICKGLMALPVAKLTDEQRDAIGKVAAQAMFDLKDWPASADALRYGARAAATPMDRERLQAMADALMANEPPRIGDQTAENFNQAMLLAMKWQADRIYEDAKVLVSEPKEIQREEGIKRILSGTRTRLAKTEAFVPGYSIQRWPGLCRILATVMVGQVEKAVEVCTEERKDMLRIYWQKAVSKKYGLAWNAKVAEYHKTRLAAIDCLGNIDYIEENEPLKEAYEEAEFKAFKEQRTKLVKDLEELEYYNEDAKGYRNQPIHTKGKKIEPVKFGS